MNWWIQCLLVDDKTWPFWKITIFYVPPTHMYTGEQIKTFNFWYDQTLTATAAYNRCVYAMKRFSIWTAECYDLNLKWNRLHVGLITKYKPIHRRVFDLFRFFLSQFRSPVDECSIQRTCNDWTVNYTSVCVWVSPTWHLSKFHYRTEHTVNSPREFCRSLCNNNNNNNRMNWTTWNSCIYWLMFVFDSNEMNIPSENQKCVLIRTKHWSLILLVV